MTKYVILRLQDGTLNGASWQQLAGYVEANSPRRALASTDLEPGMYVATPIRSWKPLTVAVEQTTKVTIT